jgi:uncharacterized tellurite resistance protein B-like protein
MRSILRLLGLGESDAAPDPARDTATVRRIAAELDKLEPDRARYLAAFAYVLTRVANADLEMSDDEVRTMEHLVRRHGGLPEPQAVLVVEIARSQAAMLGGTEDYVVTRQLRHLTSRPDRIELIRCLFAVAAADGSISQLESRAISQVGTELGLTAEEITACRVEHRDALAVLRPLEGETQPS